MATAPTPQVLLLLVDGNNLNIAPLRVFTRMCHRSSLPIGRNNHIRLDTFRSFPLEQRVERVGVQPVVGEGVRIRVAFKLIVPSVERCLKLGMSGLTVCPDSVGTVT